MSSTAGHSPSLPSLLIRNPNFLLLWAGFGVAALGDHLSELALLTERGGMARTDVTRVQALISFGFFLPYVFIGPIAGWWSDRFSRKWTMIIADVVRALIVFNLAFLVVQFERWLEPHRYPGVPLLLSPFGTLPKPESAFTAGIGDFAIIIPLLFVGAFAAFFSPARQAMLPTLIRDDQLVRANSLIAAIGTIGGILGAVVGGLLVDKLGPGNLHWNYHLNAATFTLSAICVLCIAMSRSRVVAHAPQTGIWTPLTEGFRYVWSHRRVLQMILLGALFWGAGGMVISMVPAIVRDVFHGSNTDIGYYRGLIVVGLALGAAAMSIIGPAMPIRLAIMVGLIGASFWTLALCLCYVFLAGRILTGLSLIGIGGAGAALQVTIYSTMQRFVPDARRGRVFGVENMATMLAMVAATGLLGIPEIPNLDRYLPFLIAAVSLAFLIAAVLAFREYRRRDPFTGIKSTLLLLVRFVARSMYGLKRHGPCTIPRTGAVIIASNHTAGIDPLCILATSPYRIVSFLVAAEQFHRTGWHWFMKQGECIPVDRANPGKSFLEGCLRILKEGRVLGIFPQGTFEEPGKPIPPGKSGVGMLALRTGAVIVPVCITGTKYFDSPIASLFTRQRVHIRYGAPIDLSAFKGRERDKAAPDEVTALVMQKIEELRRDGQSEQ